MTDKTDTFKAGLDVRRDMFGPAGAEDKVAAASAFAAPLEDMVTRYCFGEVWNRPGLDRKTRSIATLAALTALGKPNQIRVHVQGAVANGATAEEIREVLLHTMIYAGVPAAVEAFAAAEDALGRMEVP